jgi:predicted ATPase/transcriptional regulator with XRE-family HTH domain
MTLDRSASQPPPFGGWLKRLRAQHDLTQETLAERVACSVQTIRFFETGKRRPSVEMAERLADVLEVPAEQRAHFVRQARTASMPGSIAADEDRLPVETVLPAAAPPAPLRVPLPATEMIGRRVELNALQRMLTGDGCRLVTLMGPGGMGKTRLALHAAHELAGHFAGGAVFVSLISISQAADLPSAIADAMDVTRSSAANPIAQLDALLGQASVLLVLDNFEHLLASGDLAPGDVEAVTLIEHIVQHFLSVRLLITSRERLRVAGEHVVELGGLTAPPLAGSLAGPGLDPVVGVAETAAAIEESDAVMLFLQRARQVSASFALTPANRAAVARICSLLDGMPLGIELAAAWVRTLSAAEIAAEIAQGIDFLALADRSAPARHRSMRAVFEHSWKLLVAEEQAVAMRLAVFRDGFSREAALAVAGARLPQLAGLIDKSLLRSNNAPAATSAIGAGAEAGSAVRYDIHELLRQFLGEQAHTRGEEELVNRRHAEFFTSLAERVEPKLYAGKSPVLLQQLESEQGNFRAALAWSLTNGNDPGLGLRLAGAMGRYWYLAGAWLEGREWLQMALALNAGDHSSKTRALAVGQLGELHHALSEHEKARRCLEESLTLWRAHANSQKSLSRGEAKDVDFCAEGDSQKSVDFCAEAEGGRVAWTLFQMGILASTLGESLRSEALMEESLALYRARDEQWHVAVVLRQLASGVLENGEYRRAEQLLDEAVAIFRRIKYESGMGIALNLLGWTRLEQGDPAGAIAQFLEAKAICQRSGNLPSVGWALRNLGCAYTKAGEYEEAGRSLRACLRIYRQIGFASGSIMAFEILAALAAEQGHVTEAVRWIGVADALRRVTGEPRRLLEEEMYHRRTLELTQAALSKHAWQAAWAEGASLPLEEAIALALAP